MLAKRKNCIRPSASCFVGEGSTADALELEGLHVGFFINIAIVACFWPPVLDVPLSPEVELPNSCTDLTRSASLFKPYADIISDSAPPRVNAVQS